MCEEFSCTPQIAKRELRRDPELVFDILELRAYARAKQAYDAFGQMSDAERRRLSDDPVIQLVMQTEFELMSDG